MPNFFAIATKVQSVISEFGFDVTVKRRSVDPEDFNSSVTETTFTTKAVNQSGRDFLGVTLVSSGSIVKGTRKLLFSKEYVIMSGDILIIDSTEFTVTGVAQTNPKGVLIAQIVDAKKS